MKLARLTLALVVSVMALIPAALAAPLHPVFKVDPYWPRQPLPHGYVFGASGGVTVDSHDNVWIYSRPWSLRLTVSNPPDDMSGRAAPSVVEITSDGRFVQGWGGVLAMSESERAKFDWPVQEHGIAVDTKGNVWVCGNGRDARIGKDDDQCLKFTNDGKFLMQIGHPGEQGQPGYRKSRPSLAAGLLGQDQRTVCLRRLRQPPGLCGGCRHRPIQAHVGGLWPRPGRQCAALSRL